MKSWRSPIVLSLLVAIQAVVMLGLLAIYVVAPERVPVPLTVIVAMTALLVFAAVLVSLLR